MRSFAVKTQICLHPHKITLKLFRHATQLLPTLYICTRVLQTAMPRMTMSVESVFLVCSGSGNHLQEINSEIVFAMSNSGDVSHDC